MIDPALLINRLGELMADLRSWHYRVANLIEETRASQRYSREILERTDHQVSYLQEQATADLARYRNVEACVRDLDTRCRLADNDVGTLEVAARETLEQAQRVTEQCKKETAKSEDSYHEACKQEANARDHLRECQRTVDNCKRNVDAKEADLRSAEKALEEACEVLRRASSPRSDSDYPIDLSSYETAVSHAQIRAATCRLEFDEAADALRISEGALRRARKAVEAAVAQRIAAENRLAKCKEATSCADLAVQFAGDAVQLVILVIQDIEGLHCQIDSAKNVCHDMNETTSMCLRTVQEMRDQMVRSWHVLNGVSLHMQNVSECGETGMKCCQQAIVDLNARCLALARFEETTVRDWRR